MSNNLWWVQDSEDGSFSTLPTGPFLVPALFLIGVVGIYRAFAYKPLDFKGLAGNLAGTEYWQNKKTRYDELLVKIVEVGYENFTLEEMIELKKLRRYMLDPGSQGRR